MLKKELRKIYQAERKGLSTDESADRARRICARLFDNFDIGAIEYLHIFLAIERHNEIETSFIVKRLWRDFPRVKTCVPCIDKKNDIIETVEYNAESTIKINDLGIPEVVGGRTVEATRIDAVMTPLLCFDRKGFRVGYGKGFYDRFLDKCRLDCLKIGLSHFPPVEEITDVAAHDVRLDYCVTPAEIYRFEK